MLRHLMVKAGQLDSHTGVDPAPFSHTPKEKLQAGCVKVACQSW